MNNLAEVVDITEELGSQIVRYYTIRMDEEEHNLFEARTAQECHVVRPHFNLAVRLTRSIDNAIREGHLYHDVEHNKLHWKPHYRLQL